MGFGKTILCLPDFRTVVDWEKFKALPAGEPADNALNVTAINARLAPHRSHPFRILRGTFRVPIDCSKEAYERTRNEKVRQFIQAKQAQGWELASRIQVAPSRFERTIEVDGSKGQPGMKEFVVRATFRKVDFQPVRINVTELQI